MWGHGLVFEERFQAARKEKTREKDEKENDFEMEERVKE